MVWEPFHARFVLFFTWISLLHVADERRQLWEFVDWRFGLQDSISCHAEQIFVLIYISALAEDLNFDLFSLGVANQRIFMHPVRRLTVRIPSWVDHFGPYVKVHLRSLDTIRLILKKPRRGVLGLYLAIFVSFIQLAQQTDSIHMLFCLNFS